MPQKQQPGGSHPVRKQSAIPSITIKVPLPKNVKAPAKETPKSTSR
jgi:hypothetical protein